MHKKNSERDLGQQTEEQRVTSIVWYDAKRLEYRAVEV